MRPNLVKGFFSCKWLYPSTGMVNVLQLKQVPGNGLSSRVLGRRLGIPTHKMLRPDCFTISHPVISAGLSSSIVFGPVRTALCLKGLYRVLISERLSEVAANPAE
jgi:hypothetical protein